jgi:ribonuclease R
MAKKHEKKSKQKAHQNNTHKGIIEVTRSGMGFVVVPDLKIDILVRPNDFNTAMHGDTVRVVAKPQLEGKRMQGTVTEVIERKQSEFIGKLQMNKGFAFFTTEKERRIPDIYIPQQNFNEAKDGDRVVVKITEWEQGSGKRPVGEVVNILAAEDTNDAAMKEILLENGFPLEFTDDVLEAAARMPDTISQKEIDRRKDIRKTLTFTIDPVDAKDFDDALSIRVLKNGNYEIGVHIADVGHYVEADTPLDEIAYAKATSAMFIATARGQAYFFCCF